MVQIRTKQGTRGRKVDGAQYGQKKGKGKRKTA